MIPNRTFRFTLDELQFLISRLKHLGEAIVFHGIESLDSKSKKDLITIKEKLCELNAEIVIFNNLSVDR